MWRRPLHPVLTIYDALHAPSHSLSLLVSSLQGVLGLVYKINAGGVQTDDLPNTIPGIPDELMARVTAFAAKAPARAKDPAPEPPSEPPVEAKAEAEALTADETGAGAAAEAAAPAAPTAPVAFAAPDVLAAPAVPAAAAEDVPMEQAPPESESDDVPVQAVEADAIPDADGLRPLPGVAPGGSSDALLDLLAPGDARDKTLAADLPPQDPALFLA